MELKEINVDDIAMPDRAVRVGGIENYIEHCRVKSGYPWERLFKLLTKGFDPSEVSESMTGDSEPDKFILKLKEDGKYHVTTDGNHRVVALKYLGIKKVMAYTI